VIDMPPNSADWANDKIRQAIRIAVEYGGIDGAHHKAWVIDQMVEVLAGSLYDAVVADACNGEDGPHTYSWDRGIPP
jgi:hypothetical protein